MRFVLAVMTVITALALVACMNSNRQEKSELGKAKSAVDIVENISSEEISWVGSKRNDEPGYWIEVQGGFRDLSVTTEELEDEMWNYLSENSDIQYHDRNVYTYQYQSVDKDVVYIQGMCSYKSKKDLSEEFYKITDGGSCYFNIKYDQSKNRFFDLYVHGDA